MADSMGQKVRQLSAGAKRRSRELIVLLAVLIAFIFGFALRGGGGVSPDQADTAPVAANQAEQAYTCSMHPEVRMPKPDDKCPICGMSLIPVRSTGIATGLKVNEIELSPQAVALIDVETTPVTRRHLKRRVNMVGTVAYDETRLADITAYVKGRLDRMYVDYTGIRVREGDHLAEVYSPMLLVAQQELVGARENIDRLGDAGSDIAREVAEAVLTSARDRLRLLGMRPDQIDAAEAGEDAGDHITLYAPIGGVVIEKHAKPGSYVDEGDRIYTIADLSQVWIILEAYESDLPWLRYGQDVQFTVQAFGDEHFEGQVVFIDPILDPNRRTVRVRVNVDNTDGRLRPGMFVRADVMSDLAGAGRATSPNLAGKWVSPMHPEVIRDEPGDCPVCGMDLVPAEELGYSAVDADAQLPLVVPDSAVLRTGRRGVVYVQTSEQDAPRFEGRIVELGPGGDGFVIIRSGLQEGELVVTRGNFQIDSALQIQAKQSMMNPAKGDVVAAASSVVQTDRVHIQGPVAEQLHQLFTAYFGLSDALAMDDAQAAKQQAQAVLSAIDSVAVAELPEGFARRWSDQRSQLVDLARQTADTGDIEEIRTAFEPLSKALASLLEVTHVEGLGGVYRAYCPMAFGSQGASWLTAQSQIANPYFGERMLRCGTIEQTLSEPDTANPNTDTSANQHGGHLHE